jgi:hypothetical protein
VGAPAHAGRHAQHHAPARGDPLEPLELVEVVDDDAPDARIDRHLELAHGLRVAVHGDRRRLEAGRQRQRQLAARRDVAAEPLLAQHAQHRGAGEGLGREEQLEAIGPRAEGVAELPRPGT